MTDIEKKIIQNALDHKNGVNHSRDWREIRIATDIKNLEKEIVKKNIESNGKDH